MYVEAPGGLQLRYSNVRSIGPGDPDWNPPQLKIKQTKTGSSWYATGKGGVLGRAGRPTWFKTADEAQRATDQYTLGDGGWELTYKSKE